MFNESELYLISKLLKKVKYADLDILEMDGFANSPITNSILQKTDEQLFKEQSQKAHFTIDSEVGNRIKERICRFDATAIATIASFHPEQLEKLAINILGPVQYEKGELEKLIAFITDIINERATHKVDHSSKSDNFKIKKLQQSIAKHETRDTDFWTLMGYWDLKNQFLNFVAQDWTDLKSDLINWNLLQLKILANSHKSLPEIAQLHDISMAISNIINHAAK